MAATEAGEVGVTSRALLSEPDLPDSEANSSAALMAAAAAAWVAGGVANAASVATGPLSDAMGGRAVARATGPSEVDFIFVVILCCSTNQSPVRVLSPELVASFGDGTDWD